MKIKYYHIDSFTNEVFKGNPAGVCVLSEWPSDKIMHMIAMENGLPETAFFIKENGTYHIRWFTPNIEMDLCGHATLAAAYVINKYFSSKNIITFQSKSGILTARVESDNIISLTFPKREPTIASAPKILLDSVNIKPIEVYKSRDFIFLYASEDQIRDVNIDTSIFNKINLDPGGLCITAKGISSDFVSRYFTPQSTILEDPATGSAHCSLIPLWSKRLNKQNLFARQLSERTGELFCRNEKDTVIIAGKAILYKEGTINLTIAST